MKRGMELEKRFDGWLANLNRLGIVAIRLEIRTNLEKKAYLRKQPADYVIINAKRIWLLDSKECSQDKFSPEQQPPHQVESMKRMQSLGWRAGFVVWFRKYDPVGVNMRLIEDFSQPATIASGARFDWQMLV